MAHNRVNSQKPADVYKTTFLKNIEYKLDDYLSASFLYGIIEEISGTMMIPKNKVQSEISMDNGVKITVTGIKNLEKLLLDSKMHGRRFQKIEIHSGIVNHSSNEAYYNLSFNVQLYKNYVKSSVSCYAVAETRKMSQDVINWGDGTLKKFKDLKLLEIKPEHNGLVISLDDGSVTQWSNNDDIPKVEVVNPITVRPSKWSDKSNIIAIFAIVVTIIGICVAIWLSNKSGS